jgi:octaprenyl-diphosphate synthase
MISTFMEIKNTRLWLSVKKEINLFQKKCQDTLRTSLKFWELGNVHGVYDIGKGIRPALHFFFCKSLNKLKPENYIYAMLSEMLHFATLVHDDVLDDSLLRRSNGTLKATMGNTKAILIGDLIFATCYKIASQLNNNDFITLLSNVSYQICKGEVMQNNEHFNFNLTKEKYMEIILNKTGVLFGFSCCLADFKGPHQQKLFDIGTRIGILYQIIDDYLDINGSTYALGKSTGRDFNKGKITLPFLLLLKVANKHDISLIKEYLLIKNNNNHQPLKKYIEKYRIKDIIYKDIKKLVEEIVNLTQSIIGEEKTNILKEFLTLLAGYVK